MALLYWGYAGGSGDQHLGRQGIPTDALASEWRWLPGYQPEGRGCCYHSNANQIGGCHGVVFYYIVRELLGLFTQLKTS